MYLFIKLCKLLVIKFEGQFEGTSQTKNNNTNVYWPKFKKNKKNIWQQKLYKITL